MSEIGQRTEPTPGEDGTTLKWPPLASFVRTDIGLALGVIAILATGPKTVSLGVEHSGRHSYPTFPLWKCGLDTQRHPPATY